MEKGSQAEAHHKVLAVEGQDPPGMLLREASPQQVAIANCCSSAEIEIKDRWLSV